MFHKNSRRYDVIDSLAFSQVPKVPPRFSRSIFKGSHEPLLPAMVTEVEKHHLLEKYR